MKKEKNSGINSEILNNWYKSISVYPKLSIIDAKKNLLEIKEEQNERLKKEKRDYLICGTLYVIYDFIKENDFLLLNNATYDIDDIISTTCEIWIDYLDKEKLLEKNSFKEIFNATFYKLLSDKIVIEKFIIGEELFGNINSFKDLFIIYIDLIQKNGEIDTNKFIEEIGNSRSLDFLRYVGIRYRENYIDYSKLYKTLDLFENIYKSMNLEEGQDFPLSKTKFDYLKYLFIDNGIVYSRGMIEDAIVDDISKKIINQYYNEVFMSAIFESNELEERYKDVLYERYINQKTLEEVAKKHNITRERIRQIESKALRKVRGLKEVRKYDYRRGN